jgi:2-iminobutanoate/2-iminopropanoate deaminase
MSAFLLSRRATDPSVCLTPKREYKMQRRPAVPKQEQIYQKRELEKALFFSQAVLAGNTLYISGCVSWDAAGTVVGKGDIKAQIQAAYSDLKETLAAHHATFRHVVKETIFTTDMAALAASNELRIKFYRDAGSAPPASTWIGCTTLALDGLMLEVECVAVLG